MKQVINGNGALNLEPIKYQYAYDAFVKTRESMWAPSEIAIGEDIESYNKLTEAEKHVFTHVFAQLSTMDVAAGGFVNDLATKVTSPEHQMALAGQGYQEANHTDSYKYAVEHLGMDAAWLWSRWTDVPSIKAKIDYASEVFASTNYSFAAKYFFFAGIFEGVWFMAGFTPIFALANKGKMKQSAELLQYIAKEENQHTKFGLRTTVDINDEFYLHNEEHFIEEISEITNKALQLEADYVEFLFSEGSYSGYSPTEHNALASLKAQENFAYIGASTDGLIYTATPNEPKWLTKQLGLPKMKNFFETRVNEYVTNSALDFTDTDQVEWEAEPSADDTWFNLDVEGQSCSVDDIANGSCDACQ